MDPTQILERQLKPFQKLSRDDFVRHPVWVWNTAESTAGSDTGEADESWVMPFECVSIPKGGFAQFLVSAQATLRDGAHIPACVEVTVHGSRAICEPMFVFLLDRHLDFIGLETTRLLSRYTQTPENMPVRWQLVLALEGERKYRQGRVRAGLARALSMLFFRRLLAR